MQKDREPLIYSIITVRSNACLHKINLSFFFILTILSPKNQSYLKWPHFE